MDFKKYLEKSVKALDQEVKKILSQQLKEAEKTDKKLMPLINAFAKTCQGGKRIRGVLVVLGYEIGKQSSDKNKTSLIAESEAILKADGSIFKVAAAYEIAHAGILAHDDIIDKSKSRRGKPSLYQALGGNHYGISQAISLADYGLFLSLKLISHANFPENLKNKALSLFSQVMLQTTWGELLDLEKADPWVVMKLKTACYTICGPLQLGASLAGANEKQIKVLGQFGENLGIAYQVQDDILDFEISYLKSVEAAKKEVEKYTNKAMKMLPAITEDKTLSKLLEQMGEYLVERKK